MFNVNATGALGRRKAALPKRGNSSGWTLAILVAWLALLAVPVAGLLNLDAFEPIDANVQLQPWMPIYPPII